ncbi:hypothetical protein [Clostridium tepidiprofundi]|uniref:hypothetical protein n=1 Tax=Clostridium tepidiprofundi TaxID=420412 RepID=UPI00128EB777|nr:hypothetical protein [Clostridium tepidiprofundi]
MIKHKKSNFDCIHSSLSLICEKYGIMSSLMSAACFGLEYRDDENFIGNRIRPKYKGNRIRNVNLKPFTVKGFRDIM